MVDKSIYKELRNTIREQGQEWRDAGGVPASSSNTSWQSSGNIQMPRGDNDKNSFPEDEPGIPQDWDYNSAVQGPQGEPLPRNAVGWTPNGVAWYGNTSAWGEWRDGAANRLWGERSQSTSDIFSEGRKRSLGILEEIKQGNFENYFPGILASMSDVFNAIGNIGGEGEIDFEGGFGDRLSGGTKLLTRFVSEALGGGLAFVQDLTEGAEQGIIGTQQTVLDVADESSLPDVFEDREEKRFDVAEGVAEGIQGSETLEGISEGLADVEGEGFFAGVAHGVADAIDYQREVFLPNSVKFIAGLGSLFDFIPMSYETIRAVEAGLSRNISKEDIAQIADENFEAARIGYSQWVNPALKQEFVRQYREGKNPFLLQEELADPVAEMIGQMILDPLNVFAWANKGKVAIKTVGSQTVEWTQPASETADAIRRMERGEKFSGLESLTNNVQKQMKRVSTVISKSADSASGYRITDLTAQGKRAFMNRTVGDFLGNIVTFVKENPDDVMEVVNGFVKLTSDKAEVVQEGISLLGKAGIPLNVAFSEGGTKAALAMAEMLKNSDGVIDGAAFLRKINKAEDGADLIRIMDKSLDAATKKIFPTLKEQDNLGPLASLFRGAENLAETKFLRGANNFFANVYMGYNPGYAMRNAITNNVHIFIDQGIGAFVENGQFLRMDAIDANMAKYGLLDAVHIPGGFGAATAAKGTKGRTWVFNKSQKFEINAGKRIIWTSFKDTMGKMLPKMLNKTNDTLRASGWSDDMLASMNSLMRKNYGNVDQSIADFNKLSANGTLDIFASGEWIPEQTWKELERLGVAEKTKDVLVAASPEEAHDLIAALKTDVNNLANQVGGEINHYPTEGSFLHHLDDVKAYASFADGGNAPLMTAFENNMNANKITDELFMQTVQGYVEAAEDALGPEFVNKLLDSDPLFREVHEGTFLNSYFKDADLYSTGIAEIGNDVISGRISVAEGWKRAGLKGEARASLTRQNFKDYLWDGVYRPAARNHWTQARDTHALYSRAIMQAIEDAVPAEKLKDVQNMFIRATQAFEDARAADTVVVDSLRASLAEVKYASMFPEKFAEYEDVVALGALNGVKVASKGAIPKQTLLNTINDALGSNYGQLREVPYEAAEQALRATVDDFVELDRLEVLAAERSPLFDAEELADLGRGLSDEELAQQASRVTRGLEELRAAADAPTIADDVVAGGLDQAALDKAVADPFQVSELSTADKIAGKATTPEVVPAPRFLGASASYGQLPSTARHYHDARKAGVIDNLFDDLSSGIDNNWGKYRDTVGTEIEAGLESFRKVASPMEFEMRTTAVQVAQEARNFGLTNYDETRNFNSILGLTHPYSPWYTQTYPNWAKRIARNPAILSNYSKYRRSLERIHAGQPEWWRYQVNTNELLGLDDENPMYFNLEATINPLNGLTGVDFEDKNKRVNWWTETLDNLGRLGPATNPLLSLAAAFSLYNNGQEEAARLWGGRLGSVPQTVTAIDSLIGDDPISDQDPLVTLFGGGFGAGATDPYTEKRIGRALSQMILDGTVTEEQATDAARDRSGQVWEDAHMLAVQQRALGQISSFFLGVGFKGRNISDMQVDQFYTDYYGLMDQRVNMAPGEFRQMMSQLETKHPFMDTLLISRKGGFERDTAFAYAVLDRLPPGARDILEATGIDEDIVQKFYDSKGDFREWNSSDHDRFMASITDLSAVLAIPQDATKQEWDSARVDYQEVQQAMKDRWGDEVHNDIDNYFTIFSDENNQDAQAEADLYLQLNPHVSEALDWQAGVIIGSPDSLLATYYGGIKKIQDYYNGRFYDAVDKELGDMRPLWTAYNALKEDGKTTKASNAFWRKNKDQFGRWVELREEWDNIIAQQTIKLGSNLQEGAPPETRVEEGASVGQQGVLEAIDQPTAQVIPVEAFQEVLGNTVFNQVVDLIASGEELDNFAREDLENVAAQLGMTSEELIQQLESTLQQ